MPTAPSILPAVFCPRLHQNRCRALLALVLLPFPAEAGAAHGPWEDLGPHRFLRVSPGTDQGPGFTFLPPSATGVAFTNYLAELTAAYNRNYANGSGVALGDVDGDGWCDLYFCRLEGDNVLYRNRGGWRFEDITASAGVGCTGQFSTGAAFADLDGDGDLDLVVNGLGAGTRVFLNDGHGRFTEILSRLNRTLGATSLALADVDGDGHLDLYVTNYRTNNWMDRPPGLTVEARLVGGQVVVSPSDRFVVVAQRAGGVELVERGERDLLYLNDGQGRFAPVSWTASFFDEDGRPLTAAPSDWGLSVVLRDLDGDRLPDIVVCNDFFYWPDRFWRNEQGRRFRALDRLALRNQSVSSMGLDVADLNRDGHDDLLVADMVSRRHDWRHRQRPNLMQGVLQQAFEVAANRPEVARNVLQLNRGDGTYAEIAQLAGLDFTEWSWGCVFLDVDLDGWEDVLIPTGNNHDVQDADVLRAQRSQPRDDSPAGRLRSWKEFPPLTTPLLGYRNQRDLTFSERTLDWGLNQPGPWQGMALADLDNDGDLDLVVNRLNQAAGLWRNDTSAPRLAVRLAGHPPNTAGIGARLTVTGGPVRQTQEMLAGGRYLSGDQAQRTFAAGNPHQPLRIEVAWRRGGTTVVENVPANVLIRIAEPRDPPLAPTPPPTPPPPWFEDGSPWLNHTHHEDPFDDFLLQPLLSRRLSALGPGVAWFDGDGDGWDDLLVAGGRGRSLTAFRNHSGRRFAPWDLPLLNRFPSPHGQTTVLGARSASNQWTLLAGVSAYASAPGSGPAVLVARPQEDTFTELAPALEASVGPLALGDLDGDGTLDLFLGARVQPAHYPRSAPSLLYRGSLDPQGRLTWSRRDDANEPALASAGMVSGALWADLTGNGFPELILATDWGPLRLYRNQRGRLEAWNPPLHRAGQPAGMRLEDLTGWWNAVATGDFDGDGRLDWVAANWGRNTRFQRFLARPLRLYFSDLDHGYTELLDAVFEPALGAYAPWRDYESVTRSLPWVAGHLPTFRAFGEATIEHVLGSLASEFSFREARTLDSIVLLNRGDHFALSPLPVEAQFAPVFGLAVADFDGDGHTDVFLAQNFFDVEPETSRYDAGRGLLLQGNGQGGFTAVPGQVSGLRLYGQQRGAAVADFDRDGRPDLVVSQHGDALKLYRNRQARPGLRVRLAGTPGNPDGVGAVLRPHREGTPGAARAVHAGSGHWSQDSSTVLLAGPEPATAVEVRWPGGHTTFHSLPAAASGVLLDPKGGTQPEPAGRGSSDQ